MNAFVGCAITKAPSRVVEEVGEQPTRMSNNTWSTGPPPQRHSTNLITHLWRRKRLRGGRCRLHSYHPRVRHEPRISCSQVQTRKERPHHSTPQTSLRTYRHKSGNQCAQGARRAPHELGPLLARQHCCTTLDSRRWRAQTVRGQPRPKDPGHPDITWQHVGSTENRADLRSRGKNVNGIVVERATVVSRTRALATGHCHKSNTGDFGESQKGERTV